MMIRASAWLILVALMLAASPGGAGNQVAWTVHVSDVVVVLPPALFVGRPLPIKGTRWQCLVDKALRQDSTGNTFSTLTVRCNDEETTISAAASCAIGARDSQRLGFELQEKTTNLKNAIRAECEDGF
jgi:hypothetical protein